MVVVAFNFLILKNETTIIFIEYNLKIKTYNTATIHGV